MPERHDLRLGAAPSPGSRLGDPQRRRDEYRQSRAKATRVHHKAGGHGARRRGGADGDHRAIQRLGRGMRVHTAAGGGRMTRCHTEVLSVGRLHGPARGPLPRAGSIDLVPRETPPQSLPHPSPGLSGRAAALSLISPRSAPTCKDQVIRGRRRLRVDTGSGAPGLTCQSSQPAVARRGRRLERRSGEDLGRLGCARWSVSQSVSRSVGHRHRRAAFSIREQKPSDGSGARCCPPWHVAGASRDKQRRLVHSAWIGTLEAIVRFHVERRSRTRPSSTSRNRPGKLPAKDREGAGEGSPWPRQDT